MKTLNETFTDQEWALIKLVKDASKLKWHDFIIKSAKEMASILSVYDRYLELQGVMQLDAICKKEEAKSE